MPSKGSHEASHFNELAIIGYLALVDSGAFLLQRLATQDLRSEMNAESNPNRQSLQIHQHNGTSQDLHKVRPSRLLRRMPRLTFSAGSASLNEFCAARARRVSKYNSRRARVAFIYFARRARVALYQIWGVFENLKICHRTRIGFSNVSERLP